MAIEMTMLVTAAGLLLLLTLIQAVRNIMVSGLATALGGQHNTVDWVGWDDRLNHAVNSLKEAMAIFMPINIAVTLMGLSNDTTALGAQLFMVARVIHAVVYMLGVEWLPAAAWVASVVGILSVASPLLA